MTYEFAYEQQTELVVKCPVCKFMIVITYTFHPKWIQLKKREKQFYCLNCFNESMNLKFNWEKLGF